MSALMFRVDGVPVAQGSKRHVGNGVMIEAAKGLKQWRATVIQAAKVAKAQQHWGSWKGPAEVHLRFLFPRPLTHYVNRDRNQLTRTDAPDWPLSRRIPDTDKLARAILDALTLAYVWDDDSQVVDLKASKAYGFEPGAFITVVRL